MLTLPEGHDEEEDDDATAAAAITNVQLARASRMSAHVLRIRTCLWLGIHPVGVYDCSVRLRWADGDLDL